MRRGRAAVRVVIMHGPFDLELIFMRRPRPCTVLPPWPPKEAVSQGAKGRVREEEAEDEGERAMSCQVKSQPEWSMYINLQLIIRSGISSSAAHSDLNVSL